MLPAIAYSLATFVIAAILTCAYTLTRPIHKKDEFKSWRFFLTMFVLCFAGPYLYLEVLTQWHGKELLPAINATYGDLPVNGPLLYYKVRSYGENQATVMVVGDEKLDWGGTDHPQFRLDMVKDTKGQWKTVSYKIWNSERLNVESYVFPVYW